MKTKLMVFGLLIAMGQASFASERPSAKDDSAATGGSFSLFAKGTPAKDEDNSRLVTVAKGGRLFIGISSIAAPTIMLLAPFLKRDCKDIAPYGAAVAIPLTICLWMIQENQQRDVDTVNFIRTSWNSMFGSKK